MVSSTINKINIKIRNKIIFAFVIFVFLFFLVITKSLYIQIISREKLLAYSRGQIFRENKIYPNRGNIYDRNGDPLAINVRTYSIFTMPKLHKDFSNYTKLTEIVPALSLKKIKKIVYKRDKYTWLERKLKLTDSQVQKIKDLEGIYIEPESSRYYPNNSLLGQTLGFVGIDNIGLSGIEYSFNEELKGKSQVVKYFKDAKGRPIRFESAEVENHAKDVYLSIDKELQGVAENYLKEGVIEFGADGGGVGVMDALTGEIYALANYPFFDPNNIQGSTQHSRKVSFITDPFEPGSTFKIFTVASALENKIVKPDTHYYCERGQFRVQDHIIGEADKSHVFEWLSVSDIIKYSSNIGASKIALDLTFPVLKKTLQKFNFGEKTGVELAGESRGIFPTKDNIQPLSLSNISFGQGVAVTGVQMLAGYAAIANNGIYVRPTLIKDGNKDNPDATRKLLDPTIATQLSNMLAKVVEEGTGVSAQIPFYKIAGKTGTAQRVNQNGGYNGYISSFVGYPINVDKRFVIFVYIDNPKNKSYYGGAVAAPVFKKIAQYILYKNKEHETLAIHKPKNSSDGQIIDSIKVQDSSTRIFGNDRMPNLIGLDKTSVKEIEKKMGLNLNHQGMGIVEKQSVNPGAVINKEVQIQLQYRPPKYE